jgi:hypothetical protein
MRLFFIVVSSVKGWLPGQSNAEWERESALGLQSGVLLASFPQLFAKNAKQSGAPASFFGKSAKECSPLVIDFHKLIS